MSPCIGIVDLLVWRLPLPSHEPSEGHVFLNSINLACRGKGLNKQLPLSLPILS